MKQVSYDALIQDKKLATRVGNRVHSQRAAYHKNGPVTIYSGLRQETQVMVKQEPAKQEPGIYAQAIEALL